MPTTNYQTFYTPPTPLPASDPGYIIKQEVSNLASLMTTINAYATRVMYLSTDSLGQPNAVVGTYFEPKAAWMGIGPRPLVAMAPGTMGLGDQCAPSKLFNQVIYCGGDKNIIASWQSGNVAAKVDQGIAVFVTDYENVGTSFATGKNNTFANRKAQAYAVLDGARAALNLAGTSLTAESKICLWGYSQGGGAAGAAAELLDNYAPELASKVVGAYCGAPPSDFLDLLLNLDGNMMVGIVGFLINGFKVTYPEHINEITAALSQTGVGLVTNTQRMCILECAMSYGFRPLANYFADCLTLDDVLRLLNTDPFYTMLADQSLGYELPVCPVLIGINENDPLVTYKSAVLLAQQWCGLGADVEFYKSTAAIPTLGLQKTALIHFISHQTDDEVSMDWIKDRFNGVITSPNCATIGTARTATATVNSMELIPVATASLIGS